jgi:hypothetical protein
LDEALNIDAGHSNTKQHFYDRTDAKQLPNAYNSSAQRATSSTGNNRNGVAYGQRKTTDSEENPPEKMNALQSSAQEHYFLSIKQAQNCIRKFRAKTRTCSDGG